MPPTNSPLATTFHAATAGFAFAFPLFFSGVAAAQFDVPGQRIRHQSASDVSSVRVLADRSVVAPGETFHLVMVFDLEPRWHIYWKNPGEGAAAPTIRVKGPPEFEVGEIRWPRPKVTPSPVGNLFCYEGHTALFAPIAAPQRLDDGAATFTIEIGYAVCDNERCYFGRSTLSATIETAAEGRGSSESRDKTFIEQHRKRLAIPIDDAEGASAELTGSGETRRLTMTGPAHNLKNATFFPFDSPGVEYGEPRITFEADRFTAVVELNINPRNFTDGPPNIGGLIALGTKPDDPSYECELPLVAPKPIAAEAD